MSLKSKVIQYNGQAEKKNKRTQNDLQITEN